MFVPPVVGDSAVECPRCSTLNHVPASCTSQGRNGENLNISHQLLQPGNEVWVDVVVGRPAVHDHRDDQTAEIRHRLYSTGRHDRTKDLVGPMVAWMGRPRSSRRRCRWFDG